MSAHERWQQEREALGRRIEELRRRGICYSCYDLETNQLFRDQHVVYDDDLFRVVLETYPRMRGHTIVLYKPHREDFAELLEDEVAVVMLACLRVMQALKEGLGAEKVYLNTMCDGTINHLHLQLFPRYPGERIGSTRFVAPRGPLVGGDETVQQIRAALLPILQAGKLA
jgi:diadenosine tetraphosphate (Ap4A) HIT family hydrolase